MEKCGGGGGEEMRRGVVKEWEMERKRGSSSTFS